MDQSLRSRKKLATRESLIAAADRLFAEQGYGETSMAQIAAEANVSRATLFNYFAGKEHLLKEIALQYLRDTRREVAAQLEGQPAGQQLVLLMSRLVDTTFRHLTMARSLLMAALAQREISHDVLDEMLAMVLPIVQAGQRCGRFRSDISSEHIAQLVVAVYVANLFPWPHGYRDGVDQSIADIVLRGLEPADSEEQA